MSGVEANLSGSYVNSGLDARDTSCSIQLYCILLLLYRQQPLTLVINAGEQEGLTAWQRLVEQYGDIEGRMEAFEREILRYEHASGEGVSDDALRIGI
eukprot:3499516-Amphidinium_carterae.1